MLPPRAFDSFYLRLSFVECLSFTSIQREDSRQFHCLKQTHNDDKTDNGNVKSSQAPTVTCKDTKRMNLTTSNKDKFNNANDVDDDGGSDMI